MVYMVYMDVYCRIWCTFMLYIVVIHMSILDIVTIGYRVHHRRGPYKVTTCCHNY